MTKFRTALALVAAVLVGGLNAVPALAGDTPGSMKVLDEAKIFSSDAISRAEKKFSDAKFDRGLHFTVDTYKEIPADRRGGYSKDRHAAFFESWAKEVATGDKAKGPYVLICMNPGRVEVIVDAESKNRGFNSGDRAGLQEIFLKALKAVDGKVTDANRSTVDKALLDATDYVIKDLTGTKVVDRAGKPVAVKTTDPVKEKTGRSLPGWICLGLSVLLGVWLVIGLIRAFTGGGGGGGYGGGGYGGGGGGFGSSLFGGLFGAMAGMWLYNNMFGHGGMFGGGYGSDAYAGDGLGGGNTDTGAGDYNGGDAGGGDFGSGDGGGDFGGGGGDWGGGGDFGGGGDWGGGGDF